MHEFRTVRRWRSRLAWPALVGSAYSVLYLSFVVFDSAVRGTSSLASLLGPEHGFPAGLLDWFFLLAVPFVFAWAALTAYALLIGY